MFALPRSSWRRDDEVTKLVNEINDISSFIYEFFLDIFELDLVEN